MEIRLQKILLPQPHCYSYCYLALKLSKISCFKEGFGLNFRCLDSGEKMRLLPPFFNIYHGFKARKKHLSFLQDILEKIKTNTKLVRIAHCRITPRKYKMNLYHIAI